MNWKLSKKAQHLLLSDTSEYSWLVVMGNLKQQFMAAFRQGSPQSQNREEFQSLKDHRLWAKKVMHLIADDLHLPFSVIKQSIHSGSMQSLIDWIQSSESDIKGRKQLQSRQTINQLSQIRHVVKRACELSFPTEERFNVFAHYPENRSVGGYEYKKLEVKT